MQNRSACPKVTRSPARLWIYWSGPESPTSWYTAVFTLYDSGIEARFGTWERRCAVLSLEERGAWLEQADALFALPPLSEPPQLGEGIAGRFSDGRTYAVTANQLSPEHKSALRSLGCLALATFGRPARALGGITPNLAAELGFPETCRTSGGFEQSGER